MAMAQWPLVASALGTPSGVAAWKTIPSWYLIAKKRPRDSPGGRADHGQESQRTHTQEIAGSHVAMMSHPEVVTAMIVEAALRR